jgi:hypothetical protein
MDVKTRKRTIAQETTLGFEDMPSEIREMIFIKAGSWKARNRVSALSVCKQWHKETSECSKVMSKVMIESSGGSVDIAFMKACRLGKERVVREFLNHKSRSDWSCGHAIVNAASKGHDSILRMLLDHDSGIFKADCLGGQA